MLEQILEASGGANGKDGEGLFTRVCSDRTRGDGCERKEADLDQILGRNSSP